MYGDETCGIMSIKYMNVQKPTTGETIYQTYPMYWGSKNPITGLLALILICCVGNNWSVGDENSTLVVSSTFARLPSSMYTDKECPHDVVTHYSEANYNESATIGGYMAPSPYLTGDLKNSSYSLTKHPGSEYNCLSDFDGYGNTEKIIAQRGKKNYSTWKPTWDGEEDYPIASCCDMFFTDGTKQGDWYLPAMGELGYVIARLKEIATTIDKLVETYGKYECFSSLGFINSVIYSSTEGTLFRIRGVDLRDGTVCDFVKPATLANLAVVAFTRLKP